ncbi:glycoside hydrolase family 25 protein [Pseudomonas sp. CGJS7]|uniref:glycoside hydrolase family 25 protein n=1 Tax=Pseudomonas sp. CGJS7 TaxID=3109348 RepID=UPI00300AD47C
MSSPNDIQGIDVSHYQGTIDWTTVKAAGIAFAYAKATDGNTYLDPMFQTNWSGMQAAGVLRGAYHFYETHDDPVTQANWFVANVGALGAGDLPPVVDIESYNGDYGGNSVAANLQIWLDTVETALGRRPMIYTNPSFWQQTVGAGFSGYPLWIAEYGVSAPTVPTDWSRWNLWQYSQSGSVDGVDGSVDLDVFAAPDLGELLRWMLTR